MADITELINEFKELCQWLEQLNEGKRFEKEVRELYNRKQSTQTK